MIVSVGKQAYIFLCSVLGGITIGVTYDIFRVKRKIFKTGTFMVNFEDFLYWILVAIVMFITVYNSNQGEVRGYIFIGTFLGIIFYIFALSNIVMRILVFIISMILKLFRIIVYPIILICKGLVRPYNYMKRLITTSIISVKKNARIKISKFKLVKRFMRNILKSN